MAIDAKEVSLGPVDSPLRRSALVDDKPLWTYTANLEESPFYEEAGVTGEDMGISRYLRRPIIGRDKPVNGGVYASFDPATHRPIGEAIVVDDTDSPVTQRTYADFLTNLKQTAEANGTRINQEALDAANNTARDIMKYDLIGVEDVLTKYKLLPGNKINLDAFITEGIGVCRHQALLVGYLLERMKKEGYLRGRVSLDRNFVPGKGGHAWVRYTNSGGEVYILDPARGLVEKLERAKEVGGWDYQRPEDRQSIVGVRSRF